MHLTKTFAALVVISSLARPAFAQGRMTPTDPVLQRLVSIERNTARTATSTHLIAGSSRELVAQLELQVAETGAVVESNQSLLGTLQDIEVLVQELPELVRAVDALLPGLSRRNIGPFDVELTAGSCGANELEKQVLTAPGGGIDVMYRVENTGRSDVNGDDCTFDVVATCIIQNPFLESEPGAGSPPGGGPIASLTIVETVGPGETSAVIAGNCQDIHFSNCRGGTRDDAECTGIARLQQ
ncbi:MAG: hypothetical protein AAF533_09635 [Acidobacteriota bacterium]